MVWCTSSPAVPHIFIVSNRIFHLYCPTLPSDLDVNMVEILFEVFMSCWQYPILKITFEILYFNRLYRDYNKSFCSQFFFLSIIWMRKVEIRTHAGKNIQSGPRQITFNNFTSRLKRYNLACSIKQPIWIFMQITTISSNRLT